MTATVSIDGVLVAPEQATISIFDRGFLYGDGVFEVLRSWGGVVVDLEAHLERMLATCEALAYRAPARAELVDSVQATVAAAPTGDHRIRIVVTRGPGGLDKRFADLGPGRTIVVVEPLVPGPPSLTAAIVDWPLAGHAGRGHKLLAYVDHLIARELARGAGADEALRLDATGNVVEGATSNVFAVAGGVVITPPVAGGVLPGITRAHVIAACTASGIAVVERGISVDALLAAEEWFVTSAVRGVVPVTSIGGTSRAVGAVTARVADAYLVRVRPQ